MLYPRERNCVPSQYARTPSSFSLIHQPVRSCSQSQGSPLSSGSSFLSSAPFGLGGSNSPALARRASSAASPRSLRMCLHVRALLGFDWLHHAGQVQEYTPPTFLIRYGFFPDPCIRKTSPSAKSGMEASHIALDDRRLTRKARTCNRRSGVTRRTSKRGVSA